MRKHKVYLRKFQSQRLRRNNSTLVLGKLNDILEVIRVDTVNHGHRDDGFLR